MKFHCNGSEITKFAILKEESTKCSFKGEDIFISSKNCLNGINKENWNLEVHIANTNTYLKNIFPIFPYVLDNILCRGM